MQLCALETHIRISRNLSKVFDLKRNHRSGPEPSLFPLHAQASGPKISANLIVGCNGSERLLQGTVIGLQDYWRQLAANSSIVACGTANPASFLRPVVGSASLLSATAMFWRLAIVGGIQSIHKKPSTPKFATVTPQVTLSGGTCDKIRTVSSSNPVSMDFMQAPGFRVIARLLRPSYSRSLRCVDGATAGSQPMWLGGGLSRARDQQRLISSARRQNRG